VVKTLGSLLPAELEIYSLGAWACLLLFVVGSSARVVTAVMSLQ